jgi:hypothetical protein
MGIKTSRAPASGRARPGRLGSRWRPCGRLWLAACARCTSEGLCCVCVWVFLCVCGCVCVCVCVCVFGVFVFVRASLLLFVSSLCFRLCLPTLWLVCFPFLVCSAVSVFVVFSCAVSCVLMDFRLPSLKISPSESQVEASERAIARSRDARGLEQVVSGFC